MKIEDRLASNVKKLRGRSDSTEKIERWLMIGGGVLLLGGIVAIVIGWFGASHTPLEVEQIPYVISGGLLGVALVVAGGAFYFSYWLTRMVRETRESREEATKAFRTMNEVAELLAAVLKEEDARARSANGSFVATRGGTQFHRRDCAVVSGRADLRTVSAQEPGLEPCKLCNPQETQVQA